MPGRGMTILIADDSETVVMYSSILLRRMGFEVISASNGKEALGFAKKLNPNIVMLDNVMPEMYGSEVLRQMNEDEKLCHIPVIMLTVDTNEETRKKCFDLGCVDFLAKPLQILKLHRAVEKCVKLAGGPERKYLRSDYNKKVSVKHDGCTKNFYAINLSTGGVFLRANHPLPIGTDLLLSIPLKDDAPIIMNGKVLYIKAHHGGEMKIAPGMGIEFNCTSKDDRETLRSYIQELLAADIVDEQEEIVITTKDQQNEDINS